MKPLSVRAFGSEIEGLDRPLTSKVTAAAGGPYTSGMIGLIPSEDDAKRLAVEGGLPADDLHVTLAFLGEADSYDEDARNAVSGAMRRVVEEFGQIEGHAFAVSMFNPKGDDPCWVLGVGGELLADLHDELWDVLEDSERNLPSMPEQHSPWVPHLTLTYSSDPSVLETAIERTGPITFSSVRVKFGEDQGIDIQL